jgi:hypothetical protein
LDAVGVAAPDARRSGSAAVEADFARAVHADAPYAVVAVLVVTVLPLASSVLGQ